MLAEELRIGNLVYNSHGDIHAIGCNCFHRFRYPSMDGNPSGFKPIPLTEEILLKCGFKQEKGVMSYVLDDYSDIKIVYETLANHYRLYPYTYEILYLHQLQNLFYAIIGKELEVKWS